MSGKCRCDCITNQKKVKALKPDGFRLSQGGILYGVFELLRRQQTGPAVGEDVSNPPYDLRMLNHWDNLNGFIECGYAGQSIFWQKDSAFVVTGNDKALWQAYARANASVGINGSVLNNVNALPMILTADYLARVRTIAGVFRPYGIKTYLSVNFSSPKINGAANFRSTGYSRNTMVEKKQNKFMRKFRTLVVF